jgi:uncharacterized protein YkwD
MNGDIPMSEPPSTLSTINMNKSKYKQLSALSTITNTKTIRNTLATIQSESASASTEKSDTTLSLEEFRRQALQEHNSIRAMNNKPPLKLSESLNIYAQVKLKSTFLSFF